MFSCLGDLNVLDGLLKGQFVPIPSSDELAASLLRLITLFDDLQISTKL